MSKPWLETWSAEIESIDIVIEGNKHPLFDAWGNDDEQCELAAAAPDMCRALLAVEFARDVAHIYWRCPSCGVGFVGDERWHADECRLDAALTKAGLATQEQRDAARKELGL